MSPNNQPPSDKKSALIALVLGVLFSIIGFFIPKYQCIAQRYAGGVCNQDNFHINNLGIYISTFGIILLACSLFYAVRAIIRRQQ